MSFKTGPDIKNSSQCHLDILMIIIHEKPTASLNCYSFMLQDGWFCKCLELHRYISNDTEMIGTLDHPFSKAKHVYGMS